MKPTPGTSRTARPRPATPSLSAPKKRTCRAQHLHGSRQRGAPRVRPYEPFQRAQTRRPQLASGRDGLFGRTGSRSHAERSHRTSTRSSARESSRSSAISWLRGSRTSDDVDFSDDRALLDVARRHRPTRVSRRVLALARLRQRAARLFVLLHVLHRAARARPLRSPAARTRSSTTSTRRIAQGAREVMLGRPDGQRVERSGERRGFRRSLPGGRGAAGLERLDVHLAASQGFHGEDRRRSRRRAAAQSAHSPAAAVGQRSRVLRRMNRKYTRRSLTRGGRFVRRSCRSARSRPISSSAFRARATSDFRADARLRAFGRFRQRLYVHVFDSARNAGRALGAGAARRRARRALRELVDAQNAVTRAYHDCQDRTRRARA